MAYLVKKEIEQVRTFFSDLYSFKTSVVTCLFVTCVVCLYVELVHD